jgi:hypothetical protein
VTAAQTSLGETTRPAGDKRLVCRYGVRFQNAEGKWAVATGDGGRQIAFREFDPALILAEGLVEEGTVRVAEVFTQRLYALD